MMSKVLLLWAVLLNVVDAQFFTGSGVEANGKLFDYLTPDGQKKVEQETGGLLNGGTKMVSKVNNYDFTVEILAKYETLKMEGATREEIKLKGKKVTFTFDSTLKLKNIVGSGTFKGNFAELPIKIKFKYDDEKGNVVVISKKQENIKLELLFEVFAVNRDEALFKSDTPVKVKETISDEIQRTSTWRFAFMPSTKKHFTLSFFPAADGTYFTEKDTTIFCKNEMKGKGCAYVQRLNENSPLKNAPFSDITFDSLLKSKNPTIFKDNIFPKDIFFQSSNSTIEEVSDTVKWSDRMAKVIVNNNPEDTENNVGGGIVPQSCFRYQYKDMGGKAQHKEVRINLCPYGSTYRAYLFDLKEKSVDEVLKLFKSSYQVSNDMGLDSWLKRRTTGKVMIHYIEISATKSSIHLMPFLSMEQPGNGERKVVMHLDSGYKLDDNLPFSLLKESGIQLDLTQTGGIYLRGSGSATFLGNEKDSYTISTISTGSGVQRQTKIMYEFKASSNRILMAALQEYSPSGQNQWGFNEAGSEGNYLTTLEALKNVSLNGAMMQTFVGDMDEYRITANAEIGGLDYTKFDLYIHTLGSYETTSCLWRETPGPVEEFLNAIHEKTFFGNAWLYYEKIGIQYSRADRVLNNPACQNNDDQGESYFTYGQLGVKIIDLKFDCMVGSGMKGKNDEKEVKGCKFIEKYIGNGIPGDFKGYMTDNELKVSGSTPNEINLSGPGSQLIKLVGDDQDGSLKVKIVVKPDPKGELMNMIRFEGHVVIQGLPAKYPAILKVFNDYAKMHFIGGDLVQQPIPLYKDDNLVINALPKGTIFMNDTNFMNVLETRSPIQIGQSSKKKQQITLGKSSLLRQYISPPSSKFYACKNSENTLPFDRILGSCQFGEITEHFLKGAEIRELCVANNDGNENWKVESVGATFKPGLTMQGFMETDFMVGGYKVPVGFNASVESSAFQFCATLPILKWGSVVRESKEEAPKLTKQEKKAKKAKKKKEKADRKERRKQGLADLPKEKLEARDPPQFFDYENHICVLSPYHGVASSNLERQGTVPYSFQKCVNTCIKKFKKDPTFYGVVIKPYKQCYCAQNMRYSERKSDLPTGKQDIFTGVIRDLDKHPIEMYLGTEENELAFGPNLCFKRQNGVTSITMSGFLKTFAFNKTDVIFKVNTRQIGVESEFSDLKMQPEIGSTIKIFDEIDANIKIESDSYKSTHPENLNLKMKIEINTAGDIGRKVYSEIEVLKDAEKTVFDGHITKFTKIKEDFKTKGDRVKGKITTYEKKTMKLKQDFRRESIARARHMKAYQKSCTEECGFAKIPGWSVNNECHSSKDGQKMSCMKFKRDASYASNVGCVASCEAERVKSFSEAKRAHARTVNAGSPLDQRAECKKKGEAFLSKIKEYIGTAKSVVDIARERKGATGNARPAIPATLNTEVATRTMYHPRCFTFIQNGDTRLPTIELCFDDFTKDLAETLYKEHHVSQTNKLNSNKLEGLNSVLQNIIDEDLNSKEFREYFEMEAEFDACEMVRKAKGKALKANRRSVQIGEHVKSLPELNKAQFTIFSDNTVDSFEKRSPWEVAKKRDALNLLKRQPDSRFKTNTTLTNDDHSCTVAKRASVEFSNIAHYVNKWSEEQASAKRTLVDIKQNMKTDKDFAMLNPHFFQDGNYSTLEQEDMKYWSGRAKEGMQNWLSLEGARIERYNKESMPVIRKQLDFIYSGGKYKNVSDYLLHQGVDGKNAFKRANIQTTSPYTFPEINKDLNALLDERRTLDDVSKDVKNVLKRVDVVYKRSLECKA